LGALLDLWNVWLGRLSEEKRSSRTIQTAITSSPPFTPLKFESYHRAAHLKMAPPMDQPEWFEDDLFVGLSLRELKSEEDRMEQTHRLAVVKFSTNYWNDGILHGAPPITAGSNILVDCGDDILLHIASYLFGGQGAFGTYCEVLGYAASLRGVSKKHALLFDWERVAGIMGEGQEGQEGQEGTLAELQEVIYLFLCSCLSYSQARSNAPLPPTHTLSHPHALTPSRPHAHTHKYI
jgi:hypothetical protein